MREYRHIALLLALLLKRSGKSRLRISATQFRQISGRQKVKSALVSHVRDWLEEFDVTIFELWGGGYALVAIRALEGAPTVKLPETIPGWKLLNIADIENELDIGTDEDEE
jgi:hypothetical protein